MMFIKFFFKDCPFSFTGIFSKLHFLSAPSSFFKRRRRMCGMKISADPNQHCLLSGGDGVPAAAGGRSHHYAASLIQLYALNHPLQHAHPASAAGTVRHHQKGTIQYGTLPTVSYLLIRRRVADPDGFVNHLSFWIQIRIPNTVLYLL
jgi:hypothetical protein